MNKKFPDVELKLYGTQDEVYLDMGSGRIDAIMADSVAMDDGFIKTDQGAGFVFLPGNHNDPAIYGDGAGIAVRKDDGDLKEKFNMAIDKIRADGTYQEIAAKYFDFDVYGD
jgi:ABC-type amino acid transport substrate-binding protein